MERKRFIIVGSGWRSLFYVRIAKALPEMFEMCALLCRTEEKAKCIARENNIYTTTSIEECKAMNPDFVVVAVNKASMAEVSMEWMSYGFSVLCETPAALETDILNKLWERHQAGEKLIVAEQYIYEPTIQAQLDTIRTGILGQPCFLHISLAHEYHGANLMRAYLGIDVSETFSVSAKTYDFPTVETLSRYEKITDGRVENKKRTIATFEFADGKVAVYEFDSEQYRSPIRNNYVKVQGVRGELKDNEVFWLDEENEPKKGKLVPTERWIITESDNPNLHRICGCERVSLVHEDGKEDIVYTNPFGTRDLSKEDTAIAIMMLQAAEYDREQATLALQNTLQDAYMAILMKQAVDTGEVVHAEKQSWNERRL